MRATVAARSYAKRGVVSLLVGHAAPASLFFQQAKEDDAVSHDSARQYAAAGSEPKRVTWYESGHELAVPQARADRAAWLAKELDLSDG